MVVRIKGDKKLFLTKPNRIDIEYETQYSQEGQKSNSPHNTFTIRGVINLAKEIYITCKAPSNRYNLRDTPQRKETR